MSDTLPYEPISESNPMPKIPPPNMLAKGPEPYPYIFGPPEEFIIRCWQKLRKRVGRRSSHGHTEAE